MDSFSSRIILFFMLTTLACNALAVEQNETGADTTPGKGKIITELDRISYSIGMRVGESIHSRELPVNPELIARGIADVINGEATAISKEEAEQILSQLEDQIIRQQNEELERLAKKNLEIGQAYLAKNALRENITVTASGLQYEILVSGSGATPTVDDIVIADFRGTFIDGTEFSNTYNQDEQVKFPVNGVLPGWTEALTMMKEGAKWRIFIPADLAYGAQGVPQTIEPNTTLIFEMELKEIQK